MSLLEKVHAAIDGRAHPGELTISTSQLADAVEVRLASKNPRWFNVLVVFERDVPHLAWMFRELCAIHKKERRGARAMECN